VPEVFCPACLEKRRKDKKTGKTPIMQKKTYHRVRGHNESDVYVCPKCKGVFIPESIFGIT